MKYAKIITVSSFENHEYSAIMSLNLAVGLSNFGYKVICLEVSQDPLFVNKITIRPALFIDLEVMQINNCSDLEWKISDILTSYDFILINAGVSLNQQSRYAHDISDMIVTAVQVASVGHEQLLGSYAEFMWQLKKSHFNKGQKLNWTVCNFLYSCLKYETDDIECSRPDQSVYASLDSINLNPVQLNPIKPGLTESSLPELDPIDSSHGESSCNNTNINKSSSNKSGSNKSGFMELNSIDCNCNNTNANNSSAVELQFNKSRLAVSKEMSLDVNALQTTDPKRNAVFEKVKDRAQSHLEIRAAFNKLARLLVFNYLEIDAIDSVYFQQGISVFDRAANEYLEITAKTTKQLRGFLLSIIKLGSN